MILVTGVSGALGGLVLAGLSAIDGLEVVPGTRSGGGTASRIDFDAPETLAAGFEGVDVLVFVSAGYAEDDVVLARHGAVVEAASATGVRHVIYTSLAGSGDLLSLALPHRWTEARLAAAPFDVTILRNGLYAELVADFAALSAAQAAASGVFAAPLGTGGISAVARRDLADVAVRVAAETRHDLSSGRRGRHADRTYDLAGATAISGQDLADVLTDESGRKVEYQPASLADTREALTALGLEPYRVTHTLSLFSNIGAGFLEAPATDLAALLPDRPRSVHTLITETIRSAMP